MAIINSLKLTEFDDAYQILKESYKQILIAHQISKEVEVSDNIEEIVLLGMGGSAIGGEYLKQYLSIFKPTISVTINRDYDYYEPISKNSLLIVSSYSGNTIETLNCMQSIKHKFNQVIAITSGGELEAISKKDNSQLIKMPLGLQPRYSLYLSAFAQIGIFEKDSSLFEKYSKLIREINFEESNDWVFFKGLLKKLTGKIPNIISDKRLFYPAALRLKGQLQENADSLAYSSILPEMNHNEINGLINPKNLIKNVLFILMPSDSEFIKKRINAMKEIFEEFEINYYDLSQSVDTDFYGLIQLTYLFDWISIKLSEIYNSNPLAIYQITKLKELLKK